MAQPCLSPLDMADFDRSMHPIVECLDDVDDRHSYIHMVDGIIGFSKVDK